jgi:hypothetical protein
MDKEEHLNLIQWFSLEATHFTIAQWPVALSVT